MKRTPVFSAAFLLALVSCVGASGTLAQDPQAQDAPTQQDVPSPTPSQPKPAGRGYQAFGDDATTDTQPASAWVPDTNALTGALVPGIGTQELGHSYFVPGFQYGNFVRSSTQLQPAASDWNTTSFVVGNLSLLEQWSRSELSVNYSGGGTFSTDPSQGNSYYHQLGLIQAFTWRRFQLSFIDQFSYLPQTQFGFGAATSLAIPGVGGTLAPSVQGLQTNYQPSQTIFTSLGTRYSNSVTTQVVYQLSPRGSLTLAGSYGFLRFIEAGNIDSNDSILSAGYNYALTKNDTIGLLYRFSDYRYVGNPQAIADHVAQLAFGRKLTGKLALQLFAGPELTNFRLHQPGFSDRTSVAGGANLTFAVGHTGLSASYTHGISGGSGVFVGSTSDQIQGGINRRLSREWHGDISFGYARNTALSVSAVSSPSPTFNSWFAGAGVDRPMGRTADFNVGYTAYLQDTSEANCVTGACTSYVQHQISIGFQWHARPMVLR